MVILLAVTGILTACNNRQPSDAVEKPQEETFRIVYTSPVDTAFSNYEIFSMNMDGSDKRNLSNSPGVDWAYSSFQNKIYFVSDKDTTSRQYFLYEMDAFGNGIRKIYNQPLPDSWVSTIDGEELLIARGRRLEREIFLIDKDGQELKQLTDNNFVDTDPAFSPDGKLIAFRSSRSQDPKAKEEIWVMKNDGTDAKQVSFFPEEINLPNTGVYKAGPPVWSPDGEWICFLSFREDRYNIYKVRADGTGFGRLTSYDGAEGYFQFSPDGKSILFDARASNEEQENINVYLMDIDGSNLRSIADGPLFEQNPLFVSVK